MNHLEQLRGHLYRYLLLAILVENLFAVGIYFALRHYLTLPVGLDLALAAGLVMLLIGLGTKWLVNLVVQPLAAIWQAVLHLSPDERAVAAPDPASLNFGRELVTSLTAQIYQLNNVASQAAGEIKKQSKDLHLDFVASNLPLPLVVMDATETIQFANEAAAQYVGLHGEDMIGKNVYMIFDMSFPSDDTFDKWLKTVKSANATAVKSWERVRLNVRDNHPSRLFDLAAYYNRDNPDHHETMMILFDHTQEYSQDDQAVSFIALSVHELRTPLTLLRGYIEVFQEELGDNISPELQDFMLKMRAMSDQLTAFVNNILNVARVDDDQLELKLESGEWPTILKKAIEMISLRAKVRGIQLKCSIQTNLPAAGVDPISITEVINNLIDNAIKYSGSSKVIEIQARLNQEGLIETTIQDYGVGIPSGVMPNLFTKFYRDHRNRAQIGGTGLGLYLSKAIINAHGGTLWVRSKEGEGSTFGFTLLPFSKLAETKKTGEHDITRSAHGWIKNHSLYRR